MTSSVPRCSRRRARPRWWRCCGARWWCRERVNTRTSKEAVMRVPSLLIGCVALATSVATDVATFAGGPPLPATPPDVYVVATSHLDTQWRWTIQDTINDFLPDTLRGNFALFEKYPGYVFSFEGAFRY